MDERQPGEVTVRDMLRAGRAAQRQLAAYQRQHAREVRELAHLLRQLPAGLCRALTGVSPDAL